MGYKEEIKEAVVSPPVMFVGFQCFVLFISPLNYSKKSCSLPLVNPVRFDPGFAERLLTPQ